MRLVLFRHGPAGERDASRWPDDGKRPLTAKGIQKTRDAAKGLIRLEKGISLILTSPLVRARQTAEALAAALDPRPSLVNVDSLAPDGAYASVIADLEKHARKTRLALVGHEPMIGELAARLLGSRHPIEFKKGAVCRIDIDDLPPAGPGDLRWMLTPKIMRALKK